MNVMKQCDFPTSKKLLTSKNSAVYNLGIVYEPSDIENTAINKYLHKAFMRISQSALINIEDLEFNYAGVYDTVLKDI